MTVESATAAAARLGRRAAQLDRPVTDCPYDPAGDPQQRAAAYVWVRTYLHWHPTPGAVNYQGEDNAGGRGQ